MSKNPNYPSGGMENFQLAESLLQPGRYALESRVSWAFARGRVDGTVPVTNATEGAYFRIAIKTLKPHEPCLQYLSPPDGFVRRLCLNNGHKPWDSTHKHTIEPGREGSYEPDDIPLLDIHAPVSAEMYREIFEAFVRECNIALGPGYSWTNPPEIRKEGKP